MALRHHHGDISYGAAELDDTTSGSGIVLCVPRDADAAVLQAELAKFPGLEGVHTEIVRQEGFCIAQFESSAAARNAHDTICAGNSQVGPYLVQCFYVDHGAPRAQNAWSFPNDQLRLPETLYETGPLTQQMPSLSSPRASFKDPSPLPGESGSQRGPSSLASTMTPHSNSTTANGAGGAPAGGFWSPPLSLTGGNNAPSAPNSSGAPGSGSRGGLLGPQRLGPGTAAQSLYDTTAQAYQLAAMFQNLTTSQEDFPPGSGGPHDPPGPAGNAGSSGVRGMPALRTSAFPATSLPFESEGIPSAGSGASGTWPPRVPRPGTPPAYPPQNMPPGMPGYNVLRELSGAGGASHAYAMPPPPYAPHAQRLQGGNPHYPLDIVGPPSTDEYPASGGASGGPYGWPGHMPPGQGSQGGGAPGSGAERSKQRLFVVVSKSATEEQIAKQFKKFGGMEYCNLKREKRTGASKGYCFVNFSTEESAAAAMQALDGIEFPTGSGKNLRVEYSELLPSARQGMMPTSRPSSTNSHGGSGAFKAPGPDGAVYDAGHAGMPPPSPYPPKGMHDQRLPRSQEHHGPPGHPGLSGERAPGMPMAYAGNIADFVASHSFDPGSGMFAGPTAGGAYPGSGSRGASRSRGEAAVPGDPCILFAHVSPHLPEHAVRHMFERFGPLVSIMPLEEDNCYWVVRYDDAASAAAAAQELNGTNVVGSTLTVEPSDSINGALRPRFLAVSSISTYSSQYPSSRGSQGISSTGSMQAGAFGCKMGHLYDGGRGIGSGGSHFPAHAHASPPRFMPQVVEGGGIRGSSAGPPAVLPGGRNGSGSLPSSGHSLSPQPGNAYGNF